jgi:hypothetical protein
VAPQNWTVFWVGNEETLWPAGTIAQVSSDQMDGGSSGIGSRPLFAGDVELGQLAGFFRCGLTLARAAFSCWRPQTSIR